MKFVRTLAPAWEADKRPIYGGGLFWLNGESSFPAPKDAFYMRASAGRSVLISRHTSWWWSAWGTTRAWRLEGARCARRLAILMEAVPAVE